MQLTSLTVEETMNTRKSRTKNTLTIYLFKNPFQVSSDYILPLINNLSQLCYYTAHIYYFTSGFEAVAPMEVVLTLLILFGI